MGRVAGKKAFITGGAQGLGEATAHMLAKEGAKVTVTDVNGPGAANVADAINDKYGAGTAFAWQHDVTKENQWEEVLQSAHDAMGGLNVLVNNAGIVDVIGSDHAPHTKEEKDRPYPASPSGTPGVQTMVPVMLTHVANGKLSLQRFVELTSYGQQRVFGIANKGRIAEGYDADFTVVDLKRRETITHDWVKTKSGWTPYDGFEATGWPVATIVRGGFVMRDGEITRKGGGKPVRFVETLGPIGA